MLHSTSGFPNDVYFSKILQGIIIGVLMRESWVEKEWR